MALGGNEQREKEENKHRMFKEPAASKTGEWGQGEQETKGAAKRPNSTEVYDMKGVLLGCLS